MMRYTLCTYRYGTVCLARTDRFDITGEAREFAVPDFGETVGAQAEVEVRGRFVRAALVAGQRDSEILVRSGV